MKSEPQLPSAPAPLSCLVILCSFCLKWTQPLQQFPDRSCGKDSFAEGSWTVKYCCLGTLDGKLGVELGGQGWVVSHSSLSMHNNFVCFSFREMSTDKRLNFIVSYARVRVVPYFEFLYIAWDQLTQTGKPTNQPTNQPTLTVIGSPVFKALCYPLSEPYTNGTK